MSLIVGSTQEIVKEKSRKELNIEDGSWILDQTSTRYKEIIHEYMYLLNV